MAGSPALPGTPPAPPGGPLTYRTVAGSGVAELVVKRSRFLGAVWPAASREEAEARIAAWSAEHPRATHNVPAYRVGIAYLAEGCSDAGEPAGTAGRPVLAVLQKEDLRGVAVVVTRYFGGTLLGAAGLVRAYTDATAAALRSAGLVTMRLHTRLEVRLPYALLGKAQHLLAGLGARFADPEYGAEVGLVVWVPEPGGTAAAAALADLCAGQAAIRRGEPAYWPGSSA